MADHRASAAAASTTGSRRSTSGRSSPDAGGTRLEYVYETEPPLATDRLVEKLSGRRGWFKRNAGKALRRMRSILEENRDRGARATVAGLD